MRVEESEIAERLVSELTSDEERAEPKTNMRRKLRLPVDSDTSAGLYGHEGHWSLDRHDGSRRFLCLLWCRLG